MKKLMMFAATMTIVGGAFASCYKTEDGEEGCDAIPVWDFKASGKTANQIVKGYKSVYSVKLQGALAGVFQDIPAGTTNELGQVITTNGICCLEAFNVYLVDKIDGIKVMTLAEDQAIEKMTVFGKNFNTLLKPGHSTTVESDILWTLEDQEAEVELTFVGFGKAKRYLSKETTTDNGCVKVTIPGCEESFDQPSWTGWFAGWFFADEGDLLSLICDEECTAVAGGTWSAKYNKKLSGASSMDAAQALILAKYKLSLAE